MEGKQELFIAESISAAKPFNNPMLSKNKPISSQRLLPSTTMSSKS
jgi:hypothetical protein